MDNSKVKLYRWGNERYNTIIKGSLNLDGRSVNGIVILSTAGMFPIGLVVKRWSIEFLTEL